MLKIQFGTLMGNPNGRNGSLQMMKRAGTAFQRPGRMNTFTGNEDIGALETEDDIKVNGSHS